MKRSLRCCLPEHSPPLKSGAAIIAPLPLTEGIGFLGVTAGPFTPLFGSDEVNQLQGYASSVTAGLERVRVTERLASIEKNKTQFLNLASHELRGPLTVVRGYVSMLEGGLLGDLNERGRKAVPVISSKVLEMNALIEQMIEAARLEDGALMLRPEANDLRDIVRDSNSGKTTYASLSVRAKSPSQVEALETSIKKMGFNAFSLLDASKSLRTFFTVFDSLLGIFGCLALAVATLGIVNTLVMAILERRREIGVLKALGAADSDVQQLFFLEAGVMGFFGGIFGVLFGWLLGRAVTFGTNVYLQRQNLNPIELSSVPLWLVFSALIFAILVSLAAGLYPASRAAKLNPVDALRYE